VISSLKKQHTSRPQVTPRLCSQTEIIYFGSIKMTRHKSSGHSAMLTSKYKEQHTIVHNKGYVNYDFGDDMSLGYWRTYLQGAQWLGCRSLTGGLS